MDLARFDKIVCNDNIDFERTLIASINSWVSTFENCGKNTFIFWDLQEIFHNFSCYEQKFPNKFGSVTMAVFTNTDEWRIIECIIQGNKDSGKRYWNMGFIWSIPVTATFIIFHKNLNMKNPTYLTKMKNFKLWTICRYNANF